jgi:hypothetical protein
MGTSVSRDPEVQRRLDRQRHPIGLPHQVPDDDPGGNDPTDAEMDAYYNRLAARAQRDQGRTGR